MAFSESELAQCEQAMAAFMKRRRPPEHIRNQVDLGYRIQDQSVEIFEIRPDWKNPDEIMEIPIAKSTYVRARDVWKIYWWRSDMKWHPYDPDAELDSIEAFLAVVDRDEYGCFFG